MRLKSYSTLFYVPQTFHVFEIYKNNSQFPLIYFQISLSSLLLVLRWVFVQEPLAQMDVLSLKLLNKKYQEIFHPFESSILSTQTFFDCI